MSTAFEHETLAQRVLFGAGRAARYLAAEVARLGAARVMVIAAQSEVDLARTIASDIDVALWFDDIAMHVPIASAANGRAAATEAGIDLMVSVGGGSTTGMAKAIALTTGIPIVAIPTTYAGSEATNVWGITDAAGKSTGVHDRVLPVAVIYDARLLLTLPVELSVASGLNALAHCIDSLWAPHADPINAALAGEGIRVLAAGLPSVAAAPKNVEGREKTLYGAYLAAVAFASAGSGLHHKICHVLGGTYNLPHAQTHAAVLPHALAFNTPDAPEAAHRIATALGAEDAVQGLVELYTRLDAPRALKDYGFTADKTAEAAELILPVIPLSNPRRVTRSNLDELLRAAWAGTAPAHL